MFRRTLLLFSAFALATVAASAQVPEAFSYQAVARDNTGAVVPNAQVSLRMTITNVGSTNALYVEEHAATTNEFGLVTLAVGQGTVVSGDFSAIDWMGAPKQLGVEIDLGSGYEALGGAPMLSVPYALASGSSAPMSLGDLDNVSTGTATAGQTLVFDGTNWLPGTPAVSLSFPIAETVDTDQLTPALDLTQGGAGSLLRLRSNDPVAVTPTAQIITRSQAHALHLRTENPNSGALLVESASLTNGEPTMRVHTDGVGSAALFQINNRSSDSAAVLAITNGTGAGLYGESTADGRAWGVYGVALGECVPDRTGVRLTCPAGVFGEARRGPGVFGSNRDAGPGVQGYSATGKSFVGMGPSNVPGFPEMTSFVDNDGTSFNAGDLRTKTSVSSSRNATANRFTPGDTGVTAGDVIVVNAGGSFVESGPNSLSVVGVAITNPAYVTGTSFDDDGEPSGTDGTALVAYSGIVMINVDDANGAIAPGDLLVASRIGNGHAMKADADPAPGTVVAKALEAFSATGNGTIRAMIWLR